MIRAESKPGRGKGRKTCRLTACGSGSTRSAEARSTYTCGAGESLLKPLEQAIAPVRTSDATITDERLMAECPRRVLRADTAAAKDLRAGCARDPAAPAPRPCCHEAGARPPAVLRA